MKSILTVLFTFVFFLSFYGQSNKASLQKFYDYDPIIEQHVDKVFHQLNDIDCKNIFVFNFSYIENDLVKPIWDRITGASNGKHIAIPIELLE